MTFLLRNLNVFVNTEFKMSVRMLKDYHTHFNETCLIINLKLFWNQKKTLICNILLFVKSTVNSK